MGKFMEKINNKKGFTLIEMVLVLFIISVLMLIVIPNVSSTKDNVKDKGTDALVVMVQTQADLYELNKGVEASNFEELETNKYINTKQLAEANAKLVITAGEVSEKQ